MPNELFRFIETIKRVNGFDFWGYSKNSLIRRINRLLIDYSVDLNQLIEKLESDNDFSYEVINKITVNTTEFFRNAHIWKNLYKSVIRNLKNKSEISIWIAGCSTGEEVYSLMMVLKDIKLLHKCNIIATDINDTVLAKASKGIFRYSKQKNQLTHYCRMLSILTQIHSSEFSKSNHFNINVVTDSMQFVPELRNKPTFLKHDLCSMKSPLNQKFDLILCRNVMIYFTALQQTKINDFFCNVLNDDGYLVLGKDEMLHSNMLLKFEKVNTFYRKK